MPAVDRVKLRLKIRVHEFEAEGPRDLVVEQLDTWMQAAGLATPPVGDRAGGAPDRAERPPAGENRPPALRDVFRVDPEGRLVTLRVRLNGRRRNADAALALLHGFDICFRTGDGAATPAGHLREALAASAHRLRRLDRVLAASTTTPDPSRIVTHVATPAAAQP